MTNDDRAKAHRNLAADYATVADTLRSVEYTQRSLYLIDAAAKTALEVCRFQSLAANARQAAQAYEEDAAREDAAKHVN